MFSDLGCQDSFIRILSQLQKVGVPNSKEKSVKSALSQPTSIYSRLHAILFTNALGFSVICLRLHCPSFIILFTVQLYKLAVRILLISPNIYVYEESVTSESKASWSL